MPRLDPFAGLRYDDDLAPLEAVIAPPYDVIDPEERAVLAGRSPFNAIHVELPEATETEGDRYAHAASLFFEWIATGALAAEAAPALYAYRMRFTTERGERRATIGVIGALGLDVVGGSEVLPHEQTMPKPKGDRLDLLRATRTNTSPIWGLSLTPGLTAAIETATTGLAPIAARDDDGIEHEILAIKSEHAISKVTALVGANPVVIADGHHRYETALHYQEERRAIGESSGSHDLVMAYVVELTPDQLTVQAIHRVISGLPPSFDLLGALREFFEIRPAPEDTGALMSAMVDEGSLGFVTGEATHLLIPLPSLLARAQADLDSSRLDVALRALPAHELVYQHGGTIVAQMARRGEVQAAILLRPATVEQIADTAHSGRRMPPKTTFFHPKPRTGMVFRPLD